MPTQESVEYVRAKVLAARLNSGESTIWRMVQDGRLPRPTLRLGKRCTLWRWSDVEKALAMQSVGGRPQ